MFSLGLAFLAASVAAPEAASGGPRLLNVGELVTADDYPLTSLRKDEQGDVTVRVQVDESGAVTSCKVAISSRHATLDEQTCSLFRSRARFAPKRDRRGHAVSSSYTQTIHWRLAGEKSEPVPRQAWMLRTTLSVNKQGQVAECKIEATGLGAPTAACAALLAIAHAASGTPSDGRGIAAYAISEVYFYPVPADRVAEPLGLSDAKEAARQVSSVTIAPDGAVTACLGVRYSGLASSEQDACRTISAGRFMPSATSADLHGTVIVIMYVRVRSIS